MNPIPDIGILDDLDAPRAAGQEAPGARMVYLETYGCQMNVSDSEIVASVLREQGFGLTRNADEADVVLINTCAIRDNAEQKVRQRLATFRAEKRRGRRGLTLGVLGCMAERLRHKLLDEEQLVDLVVGPDAYRDLPNLLNAAHESGQAAVNVQLSREETYADISPVRYDSNGIAAFVSIMRGCDHAAGRLDQPGTTRTPFTSPIGGFWFWPRNGEHATGESSRIVASREFWGTK